MKASLSWQGLHVNGSFQEVLSKADVFTVCASSFCSYSWATWRIGGIINFVIFLKKLSQYGHKFVHNPLSFLLVPSARLLSLGIHSASIPCCTTANWVVLTTIFAIFRWRYLFHDLCQIEIELLIPHDFCQSEIELLIPHDFCQSEIELLIPRWWWNDNVETAFYHREVRTMMLSCKLSCKQLRWTTMLQRPYYLVVLNHIHLLYLST